MSADALREALAGPVTPGPWATARFYYPGSIDGDVFARDAERVSQATPICRVVRPISKEASKAEGPKINAITERGKSLREGDVIKANAALIVAAVNAAPGLLATLDTQAAKIAELEAEVARMREALAWVPDVYPYKRGEVGAHVEMTWEQFNAMRGALGLAPLPDPALTKGPSHD